MTEREEAINARLAITSVSIADNEAYASSKGTVRVLGYGVGINLDADGSGKKISDTTSIVVGLYKGDTLLGKQILNEIGSVNNAGKSAISGTIDAGGQYKASSWDNIWSAGIADTPTKAVAKVQYTDGTATAERILNFTNEQTKIFSAAEAVYALFTDPFADTDALQLKAEATQESITAASTLVNEVTEGSSHKTLFTKMMTKAQALYDAANPVAPTVTFAFTGLDSPKAGVENSFSIIATATNIDATTPVKYRATFKKGKDPVVGQKISYEEGKGTNNWQTFTTDQSGVAYFGPADGFTVAQLDLSQGVETGFKATVTEADSYTLTVELVNATDLSTIDEAGMKTFTVVE